MKILQILLLPLMLLASPFHTEKQTDAISASVVKIFTVSVEADYSSPWKMHDQSAYTGTGAIFGKNFILTAAHVVENGTFIEVKKSSNPKKYIATVKWISHEADLALLEVDDNTFFKGSKALKLGEMPHRQDGVVVYGYPEGGNEISITKGIISRIEHTEYVHSKMDLLTLQIDAAINSGNSGGPALNKKGEIVGIAMQSLTSADNIGYLIPPQVIEHFLNDIKDGNYDGFPDDGLFIQSMENKNLKKYYNMSDRTGVLITRVAIDGSSNGYLQKGDVILEVDSMKIADDNSIPIRGNGRVSSNYLIRKHQVGDVAHIKLLRKGNEMMVDIPLKKKISFIPFEHEKRPRYYIYGGMVFMPLTRNYLQSSARKTVKYGSERFIQTVFSQHKTNKEKKEIVFLKSVLTDKENTGYLFQNYIVEEVNENKVRSLNDFISLIETSNTKDIKISLDNGALIVMNKNDSEQSNQKLMERYNISKSSYLE